MEFLLTSAVTVAEVGDKTQLVSLILAARHGNILPVTLGTTLGMLIANVPMIWAGEKLMARITMQYARYAAAAVFLWLGATALAVGQ